MLSGGVGVMYWMLVYFDVLGGCVKEIWNALSSGPMSSIM